MNLDQSLLVERHMGELYRVEAVVPEAEVHADPDITWIVQPGSVWGNAGVLVRFTPASAAGRLDTLIARYREQGRGMGLWISPSATPPDLPELLRSRGLHCRKRFPAMVRDLTTARTLRRAPPRDLEIHRVEDPDVFRKIAHPSIGPNTTARRRYALRCLRTLVLETGGRVHAFVAWLDGKPVGSSLLFLGTECSGLHDLTVLEKLRGQGIGAALLEHTCRAAADYGATSMALLATSDGQRVYERAGFEEVARFGYWYRSFQQGKQGNRR